MTAPFPTRRQEEWRYADLDALQPVWEQFADPVTLTIAAGERLEEVWLPTADTHFWKSSTPTWLVSMDRQARSSRLGRWSRGPMPSIQW